MYVYYIFVYIYNQLHTRIHINLLTWRPRGEVLCRVCRRFDSWEPPAGAWEGLKLVIVIKRISKFPNLKIGFKMGNGVLWHLQIEKDAFWFGVSELLFQGNLEPSEDCCWNPRADHFLINPMGWRPIHRDFSSGRFSDLAMQPAGNSVYECIYIYESYVPWSKHGMLVVCHHALGHPTIGHTISSKWWYDHPPISVYNPTFDSALAWTQRSIMTQPRTLLVESNFWPWHCSMYVLFIYIYCIYCIYIYMVYIYGIYMVYI